MNPQTYIMKSMLICVVCVFLRSGKAIERVFSKCHLHDEDLQNDVCSLVPPTAIKFRSSPLDCADFCQSWNYEPTEPFKDSAYMRSYFYTQLIHSNEIILRISKISQSSAGYFWQENISQLKYIRTTMTAFRLPSIHYVNPWIELVGCYSFNYEKVTRTCFIFDLGSSQVFSKKVSNISEYYDKHLYSSHSTHLFANHKSLPDVADNAYACAHYQMTILPKQSCFQTGHNCNDFDLQGPEDNGVYYIKTGIIGNEMTFPVYCHYSVIAGKAVVGIVAVIRESGLENFNRPWDEYHYGFGDYKKEFWIGNDVMFQLTRYKAAQMYVEMVALDGSYAYAAYDRFRIANRASYYQLEVSGYSGTANDGFGAHNGAWFSTSDKDNDGMPTTNCASDYKSGWWFTDCFTVNLNGAMVGVDSATEEDGAVWLPFKGKNKKVVMKISFE